MSNVMFDPESETLDSLFKDRWPLRADPYQRDYAWEAGEVDDFTADIRRMQRKRAEGADAVHFFGAIVAKKHKNPGFRPDYEYEVIDGQQRLTTMSLLMAAIVQGAAQLVPLASNPQDARRVEEFVETRRERFVEGRLEDKRSRTKFGSRVFRMVERDDAVYESLITTGPPSERPSGFSHGLLVDAFASLWDSVVQPHIEGANTSNVMSRYDDLYDLAQLVEDSTEFIFISTESEEHAHQLFTVLNDRGRWLEQSDLLRSHTLMLTSNAADDRRTYRQDTVAATWNRVDALHRSAADAFLRHYFASVHGERVASAALFRTYREMFFEARDSPLDAVGADRVTAAVEAMLEEVEWFSRIDRGQWPLGQPVTAASKGKKAGIKQGVERLTRLLGSERIVPILLAASSRGEKYLLSLLPDLVRIEFRAIAGGAEQNAMARMYFDVASAIRAGQLTVDAVLDELYTWISVLVPDKVLRASLSSRLVYGGNNQLIRYVLTEIEDHLSRLKQNKDLAGVDRIRTWSYSEAEIEHIYPQKAKPADPKMEDIKHTLGNLTIWGPTDNKEARNSLPNSKTKKTGYLASSVEQTRDLVPQLHSWTPTAVAQREKALIDFIMRLHPLPALKHKGTALTPKDWSRLGAPAPIREPQDWFVVSRPDSPYDDVVDEKYHYPRQIPNGKRVAVGDRVIVVAPKVQGAPRKSIAAKPVRILGRAVINRVDLDLADRGSRFAIYSTGSWEPIDELPLDDVTGEDPRDNPRNSIIRVPQGFWDTLSAHMDSSDEVGAAGVGE